MRVCIVLHFACDTSQYLAFPQPSVSREHTDIPSTSFRCRSAPCRYAVSGGIGHGVYGQVFRGVEVRRGERVAVKVLKAPSGYARAGLIELAIMEVIKRVIDPSGGGRMVSLIDHFLCKGHVCIVMELLGYDCKELLALLCFRFHFLSSGVSPFTLFIPYLFIIILEQNKTK